MQRADESRPLSISKWDCHAAAPQNLAPAESVLRSLFVFRFKTNSAYHAEHQFAAHPSNPIKGCLGVLYFDIWFTFTFSLTLRLRFTTTSRYLPKTLFSKGHVRSQTILVHDYQPLLCSYYRRSRSECLTLIFQTSWSSSALHRVRQLPNRFSLSPIF